MNNATLNQTNADGGEEMQGDLLCALMREKYGVIYPVDLPCLKDVLVRTQHILEAIGQIHDAGYIHGAVAPQNLFVVRAKDGNAACGEILFADCDSQYRKNTKMQQLVSNCSACSSPRYYRKMQSQLDCGADLYSVGAILFEMLVGCCYQPIFHETAWLMREPPRLPYFENESPAIVSKLWELLQKVLVTGIKKTEIPAWKEFWNELDAIIWLMDDVTNEN